MLPRIDGLGYSIGDPDGFSDRPLVVFAPEVRTFLADLSESILAGPKVRELPDVTGFAFWCRRGNLERMKASYEDGMLRLGRGVAFHIAPSNVPVNFAFSWAFSLLAGNANVVRLPNRDFRQIHVLLCRIGELLSDERYRELAARNVFVTYGHEDEITAALSALCDVRIIWGGDETVCRIRKFPLPPRAVDVSFPDRYSICVLGAGHVLRLDEAALNRLILGFFNDTYLMDQNACSSPRLVVWLGGEAESMRAREVFWGALQAEVSRRYDLAPISVLDKFTQVCRDAIQLDCLAGFVQRGGGLHCLRIEELFPGIEDRRCNCGYFYEFVTGGLDGIAPFITNRYQTLTYHGLDKDLLASFVARHALKGIDRIVPVGAAMDIGLLWDGYDLIRTLSRVCHVC